MSDTILSRELDDLMLLQIINEEIREQSAILAILISSIKQSSPLLPNYEEKTHILREIIKSTKFEFEEENFIFLREKLVSYFLLFDYEIKLLLQENFC